MCIGSTLGCSLQTKEGRVWVDCGQGLYVKDGSTWKCYDLWLAATHQTAEVGDAMTRRDEAKKERLKGRGCADDQKKPRTRGILSQSPIMLQLLNQVEQVAKTDASVLVLGEDGRGQGLARPDDPRPKPRHQQAFVSVNCATLPAGLVESELFGHEKGAFYQRGGAAHRLL